MTTIYDVCKPIFPGVPEGRLTLDIIQIVQTIRSSTHWSSGAHPQVLMNIVTSMFICDVSILPTLPEPSSTSEQLLSQTPGMMAVAPDGPRHPEARCLHGVFSPSMWNMKKKTWFTSQYVGKT